MKKFALPIYVSNENLSSIQINVMNNFTITDNVPNNVWTPPHDSKSLVITDAL